MDEEVERLKTLVRDLLIRIESLETRVSVLESEARPAGPEPILTCVQCQAEYKESENAEGHCKFHTGTLRYGGWKATYTCCSKAASDRKAAMSVPGCTKGKHQSTHHTNYPYSHYYFHMMDLSAEAKEVWLQMDIKDLVTDSCEWAEVGLSDKDRVYVVLGSTRVQPVACVELNTADLTQCKKSKVLLEKANPAGWCLKAELLAENQTANGVSVSLKPASSKSALVKRLQLLVDGGTVRPGSVNTLSDPTPPPVSVEHEGVEVLREGPVLEPGEDLSVGRKTDYETSTNDDMFALELRQIGKMTVNSSYRTASGKWNNLFLVDIRLSYGLSDFVSITDVRGEYLNKNEEWVGCDRVWVRPVEGEGFLEKTEFQVGGVAPLSMTFQLAIGIEGPEPDSWAARERAHHSLPQPLHLRITCVDEFDRTAALRVEQGNPPLPLPSCESRTKSWAKGIALLFYMFADDVDALKRSDVAIYYDDNGMTVYRPAPNDQSTQLFFLRDDLFTKAAYQAQNSAEVELPGLRRESGGSVIKAFAVLDQGSAYALKVVISTPTSRAEGIYILPREDRSISTLTLPGSEATVNSTFSVGWTVPRASKNDKIELFSQYGRKGLSRSYNKKGLTKGECELKAPLAPGQYEIRYYPSWLTGTYTGFRHDLWVATTPLSVKAA